MTSIKQHLAQAALVAGLLGFGVQPATGDVIISDPNQKLSQTGLLGPYASVSVDLLTSTSAEIIVAGLSQYLLGDSSAAAVSINASAFTVSLPSGMNLTSGSGNVDGFGRFNLTIDNSGAPVSSLTFTVTNTSGLTWASASDVLISSGSGYLAAAHIFLPDATGGHEGGYASGSTFVPDAVPDGGTTVSLLGLALVIFGLVSRRMQ